MIYRVRKGWFGNWHVQVLWDGEKTWEKAHGIPDGRFEALEVGSYIELLGLRREVTALRARVALYDKRSAAQRLRRQKPAANDPAGGEPDCA